MKKTEAIKNFQKLVSREMEREVPKNLSEVKLESIGTKLILSFQKISIAKTERIKKG